MSAAPLSILHQDQWLVAIDKPAGMAVHRSQQVRDHAPALQRLRNQLDRWVYPVHRLDRGTSGVLLFALDPATARTLGHSLAQREVTKRYLAVTRGHTPPTAEIDWPLRETPDTPARDAQTSLRRLGTVELPIAVGRYRQARYSLVELVPHSGRLHQLRKHMAHLRHPIVGDVRHGEGRHNRLFREHFGVHRMLLHARAIELTHPVTDERLEIEAPPDSALGALLGTLGWSRATGSAAAEG